MLLCFSKARTVPEEAVAPPRRGVAAPGSSTHTVSTDNLVASSTVSTIQLTVHFVSPNHRVAAPYTRSALTVA
eukprot:1309200-Rhodomonas_salina.2